MTPKPQNPIPRPFLENFSRLESALQPSWLLPLRKTGISSFAKLGFPTVQHEDWRYTNVAPLTQLPLQPAAESENEAAAKTALEKSIFAQLPGVRLVFVNGYYSPTLCPCADCPPG